MHVVWIKTLLIRYMHTPAVVVRKTQQYMQIGGSIDRNDTGELTGVLRETAMELLSSLTKAKGGLKVPTVLTL